MSPLLLSLLLVPLGLFLALQALSFLAGRPEASARPPAERAR